MSAHAISAGADGRRSLQAAAAALLLGVALLGMVFRPELAAAVSVWNASTAYNHCFLVLPIAAWLAYERRGRLLATPIRPLPWAAALGVPIGCVWLAAERLGVMEGRQFAALACVEALALSVLGWRLARAMAAPLLYLVFLVPFGAFLTGTLQDFTADFVVRGLAVLGIPNFSDGHTIEIPEGVFFVAEACAGLRFLIAAVAFGALYALTLYRSPGRRLLFVAASIVVPVLANGVRALGIVAAGHWVGSAQAAAADHIVYGWLFFSAVIMVLIVAGLPFREDGRGEAATPTPMARPTAYGRMGLAVALLALFSATGPVVAARLDRAAAAEPVAAPSVLVGCVPGDAVSIDDGTARLLARAGAVARGFVCPEARARLLAVAFPPRTNANLVLAAQRTLTGQGVAEDVEVAALPGQRGWQVIKTSDPPRERATAIWLDGAPAPTGLRGRLLQARHSIFGAPRGPMLLVLGSAGPAGLDAAAARLSVALASAAR